MVIGISGKIGSGKDLTAQIIQILTYFDKNNIPYSYSALQWQLESRNYLERQPEWEIKKMAGKLKQVTALILDIPVEDLEKEEVKDHLLPNEWQVFEILNWGNLHQGGRVFTFETDAKLYCESSSNAHNNYTYKKTERTVRWLLQELGTKGMRGVHENLHILALFSGYDNTKKWLITDVRFPNEITVGIAPRGGFVIRITRENSKNTGIQGHASETALDHWSEFKYLLNNDGTIEDLANAIRSILIAEGIVKN